MTAGAVRRDAARRMALRVARLGEQAFERIGRRPGADPVLEPYCGYATPDGWVLRARVLTHLRRSEPRPSQSRWMNLRQMANLFVTDEVANVAVEASGRTARSDAEGYVDLLVPAPARPASGPWAEEVLRIAGTDVAAPCPVRLVPPSAERLVISDVDDTVIETGAHSLARNLWTTFTGSALTRLVHGDAVRLLARLSPAERDPVFYVSSSPWNLHRFLETLLGANGLPRGPMFLRDLGVTEDGVGRSHLGHKGAAIDRILAAVPGRPAFLLGDTGQHDAAVYLDAVRRHPGRVAGVALREPAPGVSRDDAAHIAALEAEGVAVWHAATFDGAMNHWGIA